MGRFLSLPKELWDNRALIFKLSKNDFKTKYAGSYLGIIWAFIQPVVTIVLYWIVFEKGLNASSGVLGKRGGEVPFVIWLSCGLIPWFFFSEALNNATGAMMEYSYLVKKVVFKISVLPIIKIISALFVHIFFVAFLLVVCSVYGYYPTGYTLQVIYYSVCMFVFVLALSYMTCAVVIFFRDLSQIIAILLQIGMWVTPIMWPVSKLENHAALQFIFKCNPMYYVIEGYRGAILYGKGFWDEPYQTLYFWVLTAIVFALGAVVFKRLKPHFADVL